MKHKCYKGNWCNHCKVTQHYCLHLTAKSRLRAAEVPEWLLISVGNKELPKLHWGIYLLDQGWPRSGGLEWQQSFQPLKTRQDTCGHMGPRGRLCVSARGYYCLPFNGALSLNIETWSQGGYRERKEWRCPLKTALVLLLLSHFSHVRLRATP